MAETNDPNNDNTLPYNDQQQTQYQHLSLFPPSDQPFQNQYNTQPQMQPGQIYTPSQINNTNYYQAYPQINNMTYSNNTPLINTELNNQYLSPKRRVLQLIFSITLYVSGIITLLKIFNTEYSVTILIDLVFSILVIILASIMIYYTIKNKSSRNVCISIISLIICILSLLICIISLNHNSYFPFYDIIFCCFYIIVFISNLKTKSCTCFD